MVVQLVHTKPWLSSYFIQSHGCPVSLFTAMVIQIFHSKPWLSSSVKATVVNLVHTATVVHLLNILQLHILFTVVFAVVLLVHTKLQLSSLFTKSNDCPTCSHKVTIVQLVHTKTGLFSLFTQSHSCLTCSHKVIVVQLVHTQS